MKFINEDFAYYLSPDKDKEALIGLKQYFKEYIKQCELNTSNSENSKILNSSKFITSKIIGTLMFELLQMEDMEYDKKTKENIEYFKYYLDKCIDNIEFCNNDIFISCMQECLGITLPKSELQIEGIYTIEQKCDYNVIHATLKEKTNIIYSNKDNITYSKIYYCKNIEDLFICSLYELFEKKYYIRKCKNCNRFFVTKEKGNRIKYCYNDSPQDSRKSCYQYISQVKSKEARKKDENIRLYSQITTKLRNRKDRATDDKMYDYYYNELTKLSNTCKDIRTNIKKGTQTYNDLTTFLKEYNEQDKKRMEKRKNGSSRNNKK